MAESSAPFSFEGLEGSEGSVASPPPIKIRATDGVDISLSVYRPSEEAQGVKAALIFYHGGGAHSRAGYGTLGRGLATENGIAGYMPDLRGHGASGGPRGDTPSSEQVLRDVASVVDYVRTQESDVPIFLGGHSSGGGLVVNYAAWSKRSAEPPPAGYVLVAPQLGYKSETSRTRETKNGRPDFARVSILPFILNGVFGACGHSKAVRFSYPPSVVEEHGVVGYNTVNMANAITPETPREQMEGMGRPVGLWIGSDDELFVPERVVEYAKRTGAERNHGEIVEGATHLGILANEHVCASIGEWITCLAR